MSRSIITKRIDGSILEGGGQILRNGIALAALLNQPITIDKIRNGRSPPGLKSQHRTGLELVAKITNAVLQGATNGSSSISFAPNAPTIPGHHYADCQTAGSTMLLLQVALPILLFTPTSTTEKSTLTLRGGTNAAQAPQLDYTNEILLPFLRKHFGVEGITLELKKRGYFPRGGGEVVIHVNRYFTKQKKLEPIKLIERGNVVKVGGLAHLAGVPNVIGAEMVAGAKRRLAEVGFNVGGGGPTSALTGNEGGGPYHSALIDIKYKRENKTVGAGSGIVLWAELEGGGMVGGSALGKKGLDPAQVGMLAAEELVRALNDGGCVDQWLQDQIIIFMALADGVSRIRCGRAELSLHTQTAISIVGELTGARFEVDKDELGHYIICCEGIGYTRSQYWDDDTAAQTEQMDSVGKD